jgi:isopenicillin-N epimerase
MIDDLRPKWAELWPFEKQGIIYLNHGSFGAVPLPVQIAEERVRARLRANPFDHLVFEHGGLWHEKNKGLMEDNRRKLAAFVSADADGFVLTPCATEGVNTVLKSLALRGHFRRDDEILITSQGYNACNNAVHEIAAFAGAKVVVAQLPFPVESPEQVTHSILTATSDKTRLALVDHITSAPGHILPIEDIVPGLQQRGITVLVDGAHAPGQVPLNLDQLGADFYVGNCHKWLCAPPGAAFLSVAPKWRDSVRALTTSHPYNDDTTELPPLIKSFNWTGTRDYSAFFVLGETLTFLNSLAPGGIWEMVAANRELVRYGRQVVGDAIGVKPMLPDSMMGTMADIVLPPGEVMPLRKALRERYNMVTQLLEWPQPGQRFLRLSAHAYNCKAQYDKLAEVLPKLL